jgi:protein-L-isoaspartate(D-aspartate) O-methyltransferase
MWHNQEMAAFVRWAGEFNARTPDPARQLSLHGLDLYSLYNSIGAVLDFLDAADPAAAEAARVRYGCFSPWETDPATYGRAAVSGRMKACEDEVVQALADLLRRRVHHAAEDEDEFFDAERNATVIRDAERYYRIMYYGNREAWNLRDRHMFETLQAVMLHRGEGAKAVVWAHNSHVGNAAATEMGVRGELNIGQLAREQWGRDAYLIGFGTDRGTVAAASNWDEPVQFMKVRPSHPDSYERLCHETETPAFLLPLRHPKEADLREELLQPRLERAIGVIYRPESEMVSHYFQAALPAQFDEFIWFDETRAVTPIETPQGTGVPETYPFGL